jgi:hypothetical protein
MSSTGGHMCLRASQHPVAVRENVSSALMHYEAQRGPTVRISYGAFAAEHPCKLVTYVLLVRLLDMVY